jgi:hypothetical protein
MHAPLRVANIGGGASTWATSNRKGEALRTPFAHHRKAIAVLTTEPRSAFKSLNSRRTKSIARRRVPLVCRALAEMFLWRRKSVRLFNDVPLLCWCSVSFRSKAHELAGHARHQTVLFADLALES